MRAVSRGDRGVDRRWFRSSLTGAAGTLAAGALLIGCASDGADDEIAGVGSVPPGTGPSATGTTRGSDDVLDDSRAGATTIAPSTTSTADATSPDATAERSVDDPDDAVVAVEGFVFPLPDGWELVQDALVATEFQQQALACASAEVIDDPAPPDSGKASIAHAVAQLCVSERTDDLELAAWLSDRGLTAWTPRVYGECDVLELPGGLERRLAYAQTPTTRAEIAVMVTTTPELTERRSDDIEAALAAMRCPTI